MAMKISVQKYMDDTNFRKKDCNKVSSVLETAEPLGCGICTSLVSLQFYKLLLSRLSSVMGLL